ncbi:hypothetical protein Bphyt_2785 [Paraburkholderia phytofirmans PsJN]|uniref:PAAR repeat-containing protein n=2 Tax=Paraburkholderia phytofirmans TaxID=261302 RepID=B2SZJ1_PARPJ|nr:hypothetical protein Bphyt_2785 [Paraburkholderia phytofirmans PsJN]
MLNERADMNVGDTTSHGGEVISGSLSSTWGREEISIARKGDLVTSRKFAPYTFVIAEGREGSADRDGARSAAGRMSPLSLTPNARDH